MTMHDETHPVTLFGGPFDGLEMDVTDDTYEIRRPIREGVFAIYAKQPDSGAFQYQGTAVVIQ